MKNLYLISLLLILCGKVSAQHTVNVLVKDSTTQESLPGVIVLIEGSGLGVTTNSNGEARLSLIPPGQQRLKLSLIGYRSSEQMITISPTDTTVNLLLYLASENQNLEEVIVSSGRTNSRIDDLNMKVEVLGQEDMDEESALVPGNISGILGDLSIITIQRTNPLNGNDAIRMQGLDARYTQIMRDGLPLYGGFSGSLGVLSIPPLDLKQVEIIKGSASTLYGGGAVGGLINFISKVPGDTAQTTLTVNVTTLKEYNRNAFTSKKTGKPGFTLFAGGNIKTPYDVNGDGFSEVAEQKNFILHPKVFYDFNSENHLSLGYTTSYDTRAGGDMQAILHKRDSLHALLEKEKAFRNTLDLSFDSKLNPHHLITLKTAGSMFNRAIDHSGFRFDGTQYATYSELNDLINLSKHQLVLGANLITETFIRNSSDSVLFGDYEQLTIGGFVQDDWQLAKRLSMQTGLRYDHHNRYGDFLLPRLSFFYKASTKLSLRLAAGTGYKVPGLFDFADPSPELLEIPANVHAEHSYGLNSDINFHTLWFGKLGVQVNEALYYTHIDNPVEISSNETGQLSLQNGNYYVNSYGTDTYIRLSYEETELYLGYNHTESLQETSSIYYNMPFNPKDKLSSTLAYEIEDKWRMGAEASWTGNQYIYNNKKVPDFWFLAAMIERKFRKGSVVINCENLLDTRQSKFEQTVTGNSVNPVLKPVWAPVEGRSVNLSLRISI